MDVPHTYHCSLQRFLQITHFRAEVVLIISNHEPLLGLRVLCYYGQVATDGQGMKCLALVAQTLISIELVVPSFIEANAEVRDLLFQ